MGAILLFTGRVQAETVFPSLKWHNRVLVLSVGDNISDVEEQISLFRPLLAEIEDRELLILRLNAQVLEKVPDLSPFPFQTRILDDAKDRRYLEGIFKSDINGLKVSLIGLDGGLKQSWDGVVSPDVVFEVIDAMPLRQE